jgi:hypothetical protein
MREHHEEVGHRLSIPRRAELPYRSNIRTYQEPHSIPSRRPLRPLGEGRHEDVVRGCTFLPTKAPMIPSPRPMRPLDESERGTHHEEVGHRLRVP